jgi:hypothetical protein
MRTTRSRTASSTASRPTMLVSTSAQIPTQTSQRPPIIRSRSAALLSINDRPHPLKERNLSLITAIAAIVGLDALVLSLLAYVMRAPFQLMPAQTEATGYATPRVAFAPVVSAQLPRERPAVRPVSVGEAASMRTVRAGFRARV